MFSQEYLSQLKKSKEYQILSSNLQEKGLKMKLEVSPSPFFTSCTIDLDREMIHSIINTAIELTFTFGVYNKKDSSLWSHSQEKLCFWRLGKEPKGEEEVKASRKGREISFEDFGKELNTQMKEWLSKANEGIHKAFRGRVTEELKNASNRR